MLPEPAGIGGRMDVTIACENPFAPGVAGLIAASDAFAAALYPPESNHGADLAALADAHVRLFVGRRAGEAIACGAIAGGDGHAEVKRLYVSEAA